MTDNAGYRPTDDSALRWEDNAYCDACGHHDRYHSKDGLGNVFCRWHGCECAHAIEIRHPSIGGEQ